jgi:hypothetical protein
LTGTGLAGLVVTLARLEIRSAWGRFNIRIVAITDVAILAALLVFSLRDLEVRWGLRLSWETPWYAALVALIVVALLPVGSAILLYRAQRDGVPLR